MSPLEKSQELQSRKVSIGKKAIACITAYDYPTARIVDEAGVDLILVGDSLGMVVLGYPDTTYVTMEHMLHHTEAVSRGAEQALIVGDLPIHSYDTPQDAVENARRLCDAGAEAVKLEGGVLQVDKVKEITGASIPVLGHLGMLPQRVKKEGGYKKKGKSQQEVDTLHEGALALQEAGCFSLVLESVLPEVARSITESLDIPTIGIGCESPESGKTCDGEVAVITDVVGAYPWFVPPFATVRTNVAVSIADAVKDYIKSTQVADL